MVSQMVKTLHTVSNQKYNTYRYDMYSMYLFNYDIQEKSPHWDSISTMKENKVSHVINKNMIQIFNNDNNAIK